jgi:hypothetical protein
MKNQEIIVNLIGTLYGVALIATFFVRTGITEALRVDAMFLRNHGENTRPLNLVLGLLVAGYAVYSLLMGWPQK